MGQIASRTAPSSTRHMEVIRRSPDPRRLLDRWNPRTSFGLYLKSLTRYLPHEAAEELVRRAMEVSVVETCLRGWHHVTDPVRAAGLYGGAAVAGLDGSGRAIVPLGVLDTRILVTAGSTWIAAILDGTTADGTIAKYSAMGTGTTAPVIGDTDLETEIGSTDYNPDNRPAGTQTSTGNDYELDATMNYDGAGATIREHGVFTANSGGTLIDRHVFGAPGVGLTSGDGLRVVWTFTITPGS